MFLYEGVKHIFLNCHLHHHQHLGSKHDKFYQKLSGIDQRLFPPLFYEKTGLSYDGSEICENSVVCTSGDIIPFSEEKTYDSSDSYEKDCENEKTYQLDKFEISEKENGNLKQNDEDFDENENDDFKDDFPIVQFLGTSGKHPNPYRNVSSILIQTEKNRYVMLDCGEGTLAQLALLKGRSCQMFLKGFVFENAQVLNNIEQISLHFREGVKCQNLQKWS